jgi:hypothetical protein
MLLKKLILSSTLLTSLLFSNSSIGLDINNDDLELTASIDLNRLVNYAESTTYLLDIAYLYTDGNNMSSVGVSAQNTIQGAQGLTLGFGIKAVFASDFLAAPLYAKAIYLLPLNDTLPSTSIVGHFAYAPSVLSFRDAEKYVAFRVEADMEVINNVHIFTGYRNIDTDFTSHTHTFNDSFYAGMKLSF